MAISLKQLARPELRAFHMTLVAEGGLGKTTLGAMQPNPVFIRTEDGAASLLGADVAMFPVAETVQDVFDAIGALATEEHDYKTLVIDSITQLNVLIEHEVLASDARAKSLNSAHGGYGAGFSMAAEKHRQVREWCEQLSAHKGMNVIYLAHADVEQVDLPDQDTYTRYTIRMNRRSVAHYSDNVDLVGYIKLKTYVKGDEKKKAISDGSRVITCYPTPSHISKNRYNIVEDIPFTLDRNPFADILPQLKQPKLKEAKNG
jgi:hypothetical protein